MQGLSRLISKDMLANMPYLAGITLNLRVVLICGGGNVWSRRGCLR